MVLAAVPRVVNLERVPVGSDGDVAWYGINALDWVDRGVWPYYIRELYGTEPLSVYGIGAMIPFVGINETTPRLASALWNVIGIGLLYVAAYWLLADASDGVRVRAGLLAALAGAISLHAIFVSRLGLPASYIPAVVALLIACTAWARAKGRLWRWALAGGALALTQYIYIAARVIPLAVIVWFLHDALFNREGFKARWRGWVMMAVVALVLVSPNLYTYLTMPKAFFGRAEAATPYSGALIWTFDTARYGGPLGLFGQKLVNNFRAVGIAWPSGPYTTELGQPILTPLFFIEFLLTLIILIRQPGRIAVAWLWPVMPLVLLPDLLTSATTAPHAMRQIDVLTFVFLLAGIGLAYGWEILSPQPPLHFMAEGEQRQGGVSNHFPYEHQDQSRNATSTLTPVGYLAQAQSPIARKRGRGIRYAILGLAAVVIALPAVRDIHRYFDLLVPQQYANPEISWRSDQASLDISRRIVAQPDTAYLIPYTEWERSTISWMTAGAFRQRSSPIMTNGTLKIDDPSQWVTIMRPADPFRVRWDGSTAQVDDRLWVLLDKGQTLLLPPLTIIQVRDLQDALYQVRTAGEALTDLSGQQIATFYNVPTPDGLFAERQVIDYPTDATFGGELHLAGYSVQSVELSRGAPFFVSLYWTTLKPPSEDYEIFVQLWNDAGQAVTQWQNVPFGAMYRTRIWRGDEMLATHHWLQLPDDATFGRYRVVVGVYRTLKGQRVTVEGTNADMVNNVAIVGHLRIGLAEMPDTLSASPQAITLGDILNIKGMEAAVDDKPQPLDSQWTVKGGQTIHLKLLWDVLKDPPLDYTMFLHLTRVGADQPSAQVDRLIRPDFPTGVWRQGDEINDALNFALPADILAGNYELWLGVYYWQTGERLAIHTRGDGDVTPDQRLRLTKVKVE